MKITNPNKTTVFARNAKPVHLSDITATAVKVTFGGYTVGTFTPLDGALDIPLKELLAAYCFPVPSASGLATSSYVVTVKLEASGTDTTEKTGVTMQAVLGGIPDGMDADSLACEFLTPCPQVQDIYPWTVIYLSELAPAYGASAYMNWHFEPVADLLRADGSVIGRVDLSDGLDSTEAAEIFTQRTTIADLAEEAGCDADEIAAVDFLAYIERDTVEGGEAVSLTTHRLRCIVRQSKANYREFFFRNRFGAPDRVHSRGSLTLAPESEYSHFVSDGVRDGRNDEYSEVWEVNTGRFTGTDEQHLWEDFFRSDFHYVMDQSGAVFPVVISDVKMEAAVSGVNSASFKYRLCEDPAAVAGHTRTDLEDFSMDALTGDVTTEAGSGSGSSGGAISGALLAERLDSIEAAIAKRRPIIPLTQAEYDALTSLEDAFYAIYEED